LNGKRLEGLIHQGRRINNIIENIIPNSWASGIDALLVLISEGFVTNQHADGTSRIKLFFAVSSHITISHTPVSRS
jgi:hypothetical protein